MRGQNGEKYNVIICVHGFRRVQERSAVLIQKVHRGAPEHDAVIRADPVQPFALVLRVQPGKCDLKQRQAVGIIIFLYLRGAVLKDCAGFLGIDEIIVGADRLLNRSRKDCADRFACGIFTRARDVIIPQGNVVNMRVSGGDAEQPDKLRVRISHGKPRNFKPVAVEGACKRGVPCSDRRPFPGGQCNIGLLHITPVHAVLACGDRSELRLVRNQMIGGSLQLQGVHCRRIARLRRQRFPCICRI